jgi:hypothetical protein
MRAVARRSDVEAARIRARPRDGEREVRLQRGA